MTTITLEQIINFLLEAPMFGDLDAMELSEIVHIMQVQRIRDGHVVFREGDPGDAWYVVYAGKVGIFKSDDFHPSHCVATLGPRGLFGEMAIVDHSPRSATVIAQGDVTLFRFPRRDYESLLKQGNLAAYKLVYEIAKVLSQRVRGVTQQLTEALSDQTRIEAD
jgi:CRP-like cAMP-binding protein